MKLNRGAAAIVKTMAANAERLNVAVERPKNSALILDCGVHAAGGLEAGLRLAEACLGGYGAVSIQRGALTGQDVVISTDAPVAACMGAQYAGWAISPDGLDYFAMGSGPMRAAANREPIIEELGCRETAQENDMVVGVLETGKLPSPEVAAYVAEACGVAPPQVALLAAPTGSLAGSIQVVARSVETALHKMHELGFPLKSVRHGFGAAPLPPIAADDLQGIGWTNDAVLYGGETTLWVDCDDEVIEDLGPKIPSGSSRDYGVPFADIFKRYDGDFYKIDPLLFSPAVVHLQSLKSSRRFTFGATNVELLRNSFQLDG